MKIYYKISNNTYYPLDNVYNITIEDDIKDIYNKKRTISELSLTINKHIGGTFYTSRHYGKFTYEDISKIDLNSNKDILDNIDNI